MKRLLMFAAVVAVAFGSQAFAQHNLPPTAPSGGKRSMAPNQDAPNQRLNYPTGPGQNPKEYNASPLANAQPFLPKDTKVGVGWMVGKRCDQNGNFNEQSSTMCMIWISHSAGKVYVFRPSKGEGDRFFVRQGNSNSLYVHFSPEPDIYRIVEQSPAAQQFASANGYQLNPQNNTMVASNGAAPAPARTINCKNSNIPLGDRIACASGTANVGTTVATAPTAPAPQGSPAADCSKGNFIERKLCRELGGAGAAAVGTVKP